MKYHSKQIQEAVMKIPNGHYTLEELLTFIALELVGDSDKGA